MLGRAVLMLAFLALQCGRDLKKPATGFDLSRYAGSWCGDDYYEDVNEDGDSVKLGSTVRIDAVNKRIHLETYGPPPMSRIADADTTIAMTGPTRGCFMFEDSWYNRGTGRIEFNDSVIVVEITIDSSANSDWQLFEGRVIFSPME